MSCPTDDWAPRITGPTWRGLWAAATITVGGRAPARWLCETASGVDGDEFLAELDSPATRRCTTHLDAMLARLATGEPLQYVLGRWAFRRLDLMVDRRVLIPRPETELVVEVALTLALALPRPIVCADLGTGSGAIGLALATELPLEGVTVWLTDVSTAALDVARANLAGVGRGAANVRLAHGSWFEALPFRLRGALDVVACNPPYVADDDPAVEAIVRDWEPALALFGGRDGTAGIAAVAGGSATWLRPGGWLVLEIGAGQATDVRRLLSGAGLDQIEIRADLTGHDRIAIARRPGGQAKRAAT